MYHELASHINTTMCDSVSLKDKDNILYTVQMTLSTANCCSSGWRHLRFSIHTFRSEKSLVFLKWFNYFESAKANIIKTQ